MLDGLVETISRCLNKNGYLLFFTLNGDSVMELLHPTMASHNLWENKHVFRVGQQAIQDTNVVIELTGQERSGPACLKPLLNLRQNTYHILISSRSSTARGSTLLNTTQQTERSCYRKASDCSLACIPMECYVDPNPSFPNSPKGILPERSS